MYRSASKRSPPRSDPLYKVGSGTMEVCAGSGQLATGADYLQWRNG